MTFDSLTNRGEFFSNHYLDAIIAGDLGDLRRQWGEAEAAHKETARSRLRSLSKPFFAARATVSEASLAARPDAICTLNGHVLEALGFTVHRRTIELTHTTTDELHVLATATVETGSGLLLVALDADLADDVDDLFDTRADASVQLLEPVTKVGEKQSIRSPADAVGELFSTDDPPRWVMVVAGRIVLLAERARWAEGRFLAVDLDAALERNDTRKAGELETIAALFSTDVLVPEAGQAVIDELTDKSQKHAVGVSKELREGIRQSVEILANEVINRRLAANLAVYSGANSVDPRDLTRECLRFLYRLLVLLYAESRPDLGIVPVNDEVYQAGYSLDRLRELTLVDLDTDEARNGSHLDQSLRALFELVNRGYHAEHAQTALRFDLDAVDPGESYEDYLQFPGLDAQLFDKTSTPLIDGVTLRNEAFQQVLQLLMLSREGQGRNASRGFISYAQLGINQLGAVYEGLMAYTGFFAKEDLYEVAKGADPTDGTWVVPVDKADEHPDDVFVSRTDPLTGRRERVHHPKGSFVFRLSGRDRQRSASYYTPEVLTRCVVKHALAELLGLDDYALENGSSGITEARQILDLTVCEPALGSGAFLNEAISQLSAEYLRRRQAELGETLDPERYNRELQKVKAHFALHQSYGVDLNATAVELAEVSLWLNCMHPGLKAPWFGLQLRRGNSLVGCRRATWRTRQLKDRPWAQTKKDLLQPPVDRLLAEPLEPDEIHHFLLPGHGWAAVADRKEAKEFRLDEAKALKDWRTEILKAPKVSDVDRLSALAAEVERLWAAAIKRIELTRRALRRPIDVWGAEPLADSDPVSRQMAMQALQNPDSSLGRLRTVMDAWVGLWFWGPDADVLPPTWNDWLSALEDIIAPDVVIGGTGQLDLFDNLPALLEADERRDDRRPTVAELREKHPWLNLAVDLAQREGAWNWELEFAPEFVKGGFDLQVGNPPWVRPIWDEYLILAERDPWWALVDRPSVEERDARRSKLLIDDEHADAYLAEVAASHAESSVLGSPLLTPQLAGVQTNLYLSFIVAALRNAAVYGSVGMLHPESHFFDPKAARFRRSCYRALRRHAHFRNELKLFEDIGNTRPYGLHVYGAERDVHFVQASFLLHPQTFDLSFEHNGNGELPSIQFPSGGWDLRPHAERLVSVNENVLLAWSSLFDEQGTPPAEARMIRVLTRSDDELLRMLASFSPRIRDVDFDWASGWHEGSAKNDGTIRFRTHHPSNWSEVIFQGAQIAPLTSIGREPEVGYRTFKDIEPIDLEALPNNRVPRTNYERSCDWEMYKSRMEHWSGRPYVEAYRVAWRRRIDSGMERTLQAAIFPLGAAHVDTACSAWFGSPLHTALMAGMFGSIPLDYLAKVSGRTDLWMDSALKHFPAATLGSLAFPMTVRTLRLSCLTADYRALWEELFRPAWTSDSWSLPHATVNLGEVTAHWTLDTPLRRDLDRRQAMVEIDALAALVLGLKAEQLSTMYRTQFAVLRKYEHSTVFDVEGRRVSKHHQSYGYRQLKLQDRARAGALPKEWQSVWELYERWNEDPSSVDWGNYFRPPFFRPDRESEMTAAYREFQRRLRAGEYDVEWS